MAEGVNQITKIAIIVISIILAILSVIHLCTTLTDGRDFATFYKLWDIFIVCLCVVLCILAFWGAYTENATLCYIALVGCAILLISSIWTLLRCVLTNDYCDTGNYIMGGIYIVISAVMVIAVYLFIKSIR